MIPIYEPSTALRLLRERGALSVMVIDASSLREVATEYGVKVATYMKEQLSQVLSNLWGESGAFRATDILCRRAEGSHKYFVLIEGARLGQTVPAPGVLERMADRIALKVRNSFWNTLESGSRFGLLPEGMNYVPRIAVGFATVLYNPCVDPMEAIEQLIDAAGEEARVQLKRLQDRQRELMQSLIMGAGLLEPAFQGVFHLPPLTHEAVLAAQAAQSLRPLRSLLYGFESLIRVHASGVEKVLSGQSAAWVEAQHLRPDILFKLASDSGVSLELDQACLAQAVERGGALPGTLLINILPRNLYNIESLAPLFQKRRGIIFEVSESEAISNLDLMLEVRDLLNRLQMGIAADDFGKGYNGLEQIIRLRPDLIKLDRSLITNIHQDLPKQAFVQGLVRAAQISKAQVLAEGVELWEEAEVLKAMGIDLIQGFLLHRPQFIELLQDALRDETLGVAAA